MFLRTVKAYVVIQRKLDFSSKSIASDTNQTIWASLISNPSVIVTPRFHSSIIELRFHIKELQTIGFHMNKPLLYCCWLTENCNIAGCYTHEWFFSRPPRHTPVSQHVEGKQQETTEMLLFHESQIRKIALLTIVMRNVCVSVVVFSIRTENGDRQQWMFAEIHR